MRLNKLEFIQELPKIKPFKPLNLSKTKIEIGVSDVSLLRLQAEILYNLRFWLDDVVYPMSINDKMRFVTDMNMVNSIFKMIDNHVFVSKKDYKEMMRSMGIKSLK
ncbi:hypothetical protein [Sulfuricurvum sp.]|uniref:hypothetical protein n=1 Tax=Sulfuricurvum sp. TaxID=2025608 RepID=UPI002616738E|nr:hypothetical protein [Sulfuricurvum sp.]MDD2265697.1 hypothetical protein [Sulfuricurvum sp.]MDD2784015.1 hypothetical protein [Sulfuricurvum sp.]